MTEAILRGVKEEKAAAADTMAAKTITRIMVGVVFVVLLRRERCGQLIGCSFVAKVVLTYIHLRKTTIILVQFFVHHETTGRERLESASAIGDI